MRVLSIVHQRDAGPGVFAEALQSAAPTSRPGWPPERDRPPAIGGLSTPCSPSAGRCTPTRTIATPGCETEQRLLAELLDREVPLLAVCLGSQLLAAGCRRPGAARARARDRLARGPPDRRGRGRPAAGRHGARLRGIPVARYEFPLPPGAARWPAATSACRPSAPGPAPGGSSSTPRSRGATRWPGSSDYRQTTPTRAAAGIDADALRERTEALDRSMERARAARSAAASSRTAATRA